VINVSQGIRRGSSPLFAGEAAGDTADSFADAHGIHSYVDHADPAVDRYRGLASVYVI
jgi:hypothetical protein